MSPEIISKIQGFGFDVYMHDPTNTYLFFTDGTNIGYLQEGITITTIHIPNRKVGSGYVTDEYLRDFTEDDLRKGFIFIPPGHPTSDAQHVQKFKSLEHFLKFSSWNATYKLVPKQ